jgi:plastocyanin
MRVERGTWRRVLGAALLGAALTAGALAPVVAAGDTTVKIDNFAFAPEQLTVKVGTTVTWVNDDDIPHTVVASGKAFKSKALDTDDKFAFTFTAPGSYEYFCSLHPHMKATVNVVGAEQTGE